MSDETDEHVPNFVVSRQEACGMTARVLSFYPEDVELLKKLEEVSIVESAYYKLYLQGKGRFFRDDGQKKWRRALSAIDALRKKIALRKKKVDGVEWTYTVKGGTASIGDGFGVAIPPSTSGEITIPSKFGRYPVTRIGDNAFSGCRGITGVKIPASVTSIGSRAFSGCQGLATMTIPANVTRIGSEAFYCCRRLTSLTIPDGVTFVGREAFGHCSALASVTIPDSLTKVGDDVFYECGALPKEMIAEMKKRAELARPELVRQIKSAAGVCEANEQKARQKVAEATESDDLSLFVKKAIGGLLLLLLLLAIVLRLCFL